MEHAHSSCTSETEVPSLQNSSDTVSGNGYGDGGTQPVKVAVHIRPLIGNELLQGCKDCVFLVPGEPQVQISNHSFTFDHVYGSTGTPSSSIFAECISPLVDGLFQGYNATVLAYGQTGSGKTYTMGTGYTVGGSTEGVIPKVMEMIFNKVTTLKRKAEFQIRVSFIEILKEEVHDLLDPNPAIAIKSDAANGFVTKPGTVGKPQIQIRENTNGEITLAGVSEVDVDSLQEMAACLERGSLCRSTACTNMNTRSSRSHAIFTITLEQRSCIMESQRKIGISNFSEDGCDEFLSAKIHLVDLAGSERAKRTGADGVRFKEGVHINKGLLALGNVISALGDDKKRKEGGHVPYRDSKLTRLLQDSLGGNSRTVMIACISPADSNAEETLNTLKYANRARNIQNKPVVNRDPMAAEMQRMRHQVELLQAELLCVREGSLFEEMQILKQRAAWYEANLLEFKQQLKLARENLHLGAQRLLQTEVERDKLQLKLDMLQSGKSWEEACGEDSQSIRLLESYAERIRALENEMHQLRSAPSALCAGLGQYQRNISVLDNDVSMICLPEISETIQIEEETVEKEMEHARLQDTLDKELEELNRRLEQKEIEMKSFTRCDGAVLKHHFEKKILELEEEKNALQTERDMLVSQLTRLANTTDEQSQKLHETYLQKVKALETQISELKKRQENQTQLLKQKQRSDEAARRLQEEIQRIKSQKVQLQNKIKQESEQFRSWKALREKELLQLKKEGRRNEYEMHKLQGLHQRQKMVLQRKTEECSAATRRLHELLERRKASSKESLGTGVPMANMSSRQTSEKSLQQSVEDELEVAAHIHEVRSNYEKQSEIRAALAKELANLKQGTGTSGSESQLSLSPGARQAKISLLETMLSSSSSTLVAMAAELSEAEERERAFTGRARWQHVRSMVDAKNLLQYTFNLAVETRCKILDREIECKELKEKLSELTLLLKESEAHRKERQHAQFARDKNMSQLLASSANAGTTAAMRACLNEISKMLLPVDELGPRTLEYPDDSPEASESDESISQGQSPSNGQSSDPDLTDIDELETEESDMDLDIDENACDEDLDSHEGNRKESRLKSKSQFMISDSDEIDRADSQLRCASGTSSSCELDKCANKEHGSEVIGTTKIAEALETLALHKEITYTQACQPSECSETVDEVLLKKEDVQRAEQILAKHGAHLLGDAWAGLQQAGSALGRGLVTEREDHPDKHHIRSPLSDIGNKNQAQEVNQQGGKTKQRKRWAKAPMQTVTVQLVPTIGGTRRKQPPSNETTHNENQVLPENALEATKGVGLGPSSTPNVLDKEVGAPSNENIGGSDGANARRTSNGNSPPIELLPAPSVISVRSQREAQRSLLVLGKAPRNGRARKKKASPPTSPLRARNARGLDEFSMGSSAGSRTQGKAVTREKENV